MSSALIRLCNRTNDTADKSGPSPLPCAASSMTPTLIEGRLAKGNFRICAHESSLAVFREFYNSAKSDIDETVATMLDNTCQMMIKIIHVEKCGIAANQEYTELTASAILALHLNELIAVMFPGQTHGFQCTHQVEVSDIHDAKETKECHASIADIVFLKHVKDWKPVWGRIGPAWLPSIFVELSLNDRYTNWVQYNTYADLLLKCMPAAAKCSSMWTPIMGLLIDESDVSLSMFYFCEDWTIAEIVIYTGDLNGRVLYQILMTFKFWMDLVNKYWHRDVDEDCEVDLEYLDEEMIPIPNRSVLRPKRNTLSSLDSNRVYKVFLGGASRHPTFYLEKNCSGKLFEDCRVEIENDDGDTLLSYPYIAGEHVPTRANHLGDILWHWIRGFLCCGRVHGDIRLSNMIFLQSDAAQEHGVASTLIDFDLVGLLSDQARYPINYNRNINDGSRPPDAGPNAVMRLSHDLHSLVNIVQRFSPLSVIGWETEVIEPLQSCLEITKMNEKRWSAQDDAFAEVLSVLTIVATILTTEPMASVQLEHAQPTPSTKRLKT